MSASLVGSEMCIRDSSLNCADPGVAYTAPPCKASSVGFGVILRSESAVSYTHLTLPTICSV
eukprot:1727405-Alexandrium_andersonii.AAC.1